MRIDSLPILHGMRNHNSNISLNGKNKDYIVQLLMTIIMEKDINMMLPSNLKKNINLLLIDWDILNSLVLLSIGFSNFKRISIILHILINLLSNCLHNSQVKILISNKVRLSMKILEF